MGGVTYRNQIYEIFADQDVAFDHQIRQALDIGAAYLDLPIGFFTRITDGTQVILHATGDHHLIQPGEHCPLDEAYCRRTIEIESQLAIQDANVDPAITDTAVETFGLGAYIGAKVIVDGEVYGTACFAGTEPRTDAFDGAEQFLVELIARLAGQAIERRNYERQLGQREQRLDEQSEIHRAVVDASFDSVLRFDTAGTFTYASESVRELLGYSPAELDGRPITAIHPDPETTEWACEKASQILNGEPAEVQDFPLETNSGDIVYTDIRGVPIYEGGVPESERSADDIVGAQVLVRNASARRQREGLISVINRVLRHNVRNEMTVIRGWTEVLAEELEGDPAEKVTAIRGAAMRLLDLTESAQKLEQNRDVSPKLEPTDLVPLVERTVVECEMRYPAASITVDAPERAIAETLPRIEVALFELVDNAAKYGGDGATVEIKVCVTDRQVTCRVSDDGPGLPPAERGVLESGTETQLAHGQGLGLWLSYWIVTTLDGEIEVTEGEQGTTVEIRLPTPSET
jgi:two-component system aerobic respiration control sensor histidine kinase ArcB